MTATNRPDSRSSHSAAQGPSRGSCLFGMLYRDDFVRVFRSAQAFRAVSLGFGPRGRGRASGGPGRLRVRRKNSEASA